MTLREPPPDEKALIDAIVAEPEDSLPWLVYADWLEEHNRSEAAARWRSRVQISDDGNNVLPVFAACRRTCDPLELYILGRLLQGASLSAARLRGILCGCTTPWSVENEALLALSRETFKLPGIFSVLHTTHESPLLCYELPPGTETVAAPTIRNSVGITLAWAGPGVPGGSLVDEERFYIRDAHAGIPPQVRYPSPVRRCYMAGLLFGSRCSKRKCYTCRVFTVEHDGVQQSVSLPHPYP